jgi:protein-disulfide isomerase
MTTIIHRILAALTTKEGAVIAAPIILGLAGVLTLGNTTPQMPAPAIASQAVAQTTPGASPAVPAASSFSAAQRTELEGIIKGYLMAHPEVLVEVSKELERRQASVQAEANKKLIVDKKASIFQASTDFVIGNPKGDVTVVEYFDYNCGWCKKALDEVQKLTKADPNLRIVLKEMPIFGENSAVAAKAAMASIAQGKYWDFHVAMMREKQVSKDNVFKIAEKVGINVEKLKVDMAAPAIDAALKETMAVAQELGIEGTPGFIIDTRVNIGFVPAEGIKDIVADVRKTGCQTC